MRDDRDRSGRLGAGALAAGLMLALACLSPPALGQSYRGYTQLQFQKLDPAGSVQDRDVWLRALQLDVTKRLADRYDLSAQILFNEVTYAGRPEGIRSPRGSVRFSHALFGGWVSYRPVRTTDPLGITSLDKELQISGYLAPPRWPQVTGSWTRRQRRSGTTEPPSTGYSRAASASHEIGRLSMRAGYSDQIRKGDEIRVKTDERRNVTGGAQFRFGPPRTSFVAQYDVTETRRLVSGDPIERMLLHSAGLNGTSRLSSMTDAAVAYSFRRTLTRNGLRTDLDDHEGNAILNVSPRPFRLSSGGGVRTVRTVEQRDLQWYLLLLASVEGRVRPGCTARVGAARSFNWVSGDHSRPIDTYQASARMQLARGLDMNASGQVSVTDPSGRAQADSIGRNARVVSQGGFMITAAPLRRIAGTYSLRGYRSGAGLFRPASTSTSDSWDLRWSPAARLDLTGSLQRTRGLNPGDPTLRVWRATGLWAPSQRLELSGTFVRSDQARAEANGDLPPGAETMSARLLWGVARDLRATVLGILVDPDKPTRGTRLEAGLTLALGGRR